MCWSISVLKLKLTPKKREKRNKFDQINRSPDWQSICLKCVFLNEKLQCEWIQRATKHCFSIIFQDDTYCALFAPSPSVERIVKLITLLLQSGASLLLSKRSYVKSCWQSRRYFVAFPQRSDSAIVAINRTSVWISMMHLISL